MEPLPMETLFTVTDKHPLCRRHSLTYGIYSVFCLLILLSFFLKIIFIYFWLRQVLVAAHGFLSS